MATTHPNRRSRGRRIDLRGADRPWLKREGQSVEKDEDLVEIESDKATVELPVAVVRRGGQDPEARRPKPRRSAR